MVVNERPSKRMKRRVSADLYDFLTFPAASDRCLDDVVVDGQPFRKTVQRFLTNHAMVTYPPSLFSSLMTWQILFRIGGVVDGSDLSPASVTLHIVEEDVTRSRSSVYCDQCRVVGWSGHPVCRKRYHFIIRAPTNHMDAYERPCSLCGKSTGLSEARCKWCDAAITVEDIEDWVYGQIEDNTHLLHGIVHSNGYGHLLTLNGREGGSKFLSGSDIMSFWDRLCASLAVRKVSVMDVSKKFGMEYRLLHAITNGCSWYGNWGYEFGTGCYALTQDSYQNAVNTLSSMPLSDLLFRDRGPPSRLQCVIFLYKSLAGAELLTIKDLFSFLVTLIREFHKPLTTSASNAETCNVLCAWTSNDVEAVQQALIKVLRASASSSGAKWVTRRSLKGALGRGVASPELLDYSLKHLGGKLTAYGMVVRSRCNPTSSTVEYRLESLNVTENEVSANSGHPSKEQVIDDLKFLLDSIINPDRMVSYRPKIMRKRVADSARKLLDCKQFMKDYKPDKMAGEEVPSCIRLWCHVELSDQPKEDPTPPELILLPLNATVADLKNEATNTFQEVYAMYKRFQAEELLEYGSIKDNLTVKLLLGTSGSVRILGKCHAKHGLNRFRMERGTETWKVDCSCGAKDDDGEKMLACDTCGVWQHTRCAGIDNSNAVPSKFECMRCIKSYRKDAKKQTFPVEPKVHTMDEAKNYAVHDAEIHPMDEAKNYAVHDAEIHPMDKAKNYVVHDPNIHPMNEVNSYAVYEAQVHPMVYEPKIHPMDEAKNYAVHDAEIHPMDKAKRYVVHDPNIHPMSEVKSYAVYEAQVHPMVYEQKIHPMDEAKNYAVHDAEIHPMDKAKSYVVHDPNIHPMNEVKSYDVSEAKIHPMVYKAKIHPMDEAKSYIMHEPNIHPMNEAISYAVYEEEVHPMVHEAKSYAVYEAEIDPVIEANVAWKQNSSVDGGRTPSKAKTSCRGEVVAADGTAVACNLALNFGVR